MSSVSLVRKYVVNALGGIPGAWDTGEMGRAQLYKWVSGMGPLFRGLGLTRLCCLQWGRGGDVPSCGVQGFCGNGVMGVRRGRLGKWVSCAGVAMLVLHWVTDFITHHPGVAISGCTRTELWWCSVPSAVDEMGEEVGDRGCR